MNSFPNTLKTINNKLNSNQLLLLLIGGSLGFLVILSGFYGLTRPCVFEQCLEINEAKNLSKKTSFIFKSSVSLDDLLTYQKQLQEAISLLQSIPIWSSYYQEATTTRENYQEQLKDLSSLLLAKEKANEALAFSQKNILSIKELEIVKKKWQETQQLLQSINESTGLKKLAMTDYKRSENALESINHKIQQEKESYQQLKSAQETEKLALKREARVQNMADLTLVNDTWNTAITTLQNIPYLTSSYQPSRRLLKNYLFHKTKIEKRKQQEEIALKFHTQAKKYAKLAAKYEEKKQWKNAVRNWKKSVNSLKKIPRNTFEWNNIQPLISIYTLSLNQAHHKLKEAMQYQKIISELDAMCLSKQKICQYEIKENLIQMRLESDYLEQLWTLALQAKVQANLKVQVDIFKHLATFEYRLQNITNQTGKSIEIYNSQGNLMTVYHR
ncbi:MAG: hypothetical protein AB4062_02900 [Crocosphaera sp.]